MQAFFPLRATTTAAADPPRDCASEQIKSNSAEADVTGVLFT
jgi:hypothetical protein